MERLRVVSKKGLALRATFEKSSKLVATLPPDAVVVRVTERAGDERSFVVSFSGEHRGWASSALLKPARESGRALRKLRDAANADRAAVRPAQLAQACLESTDHASLYDALLDLAAGPGDDVGRAATACLFGLASSPSIYAVRSRGVDAPGGTVVVFGFGGAHLDQLDAVGALYDAKLPSWQRVATTTSALAAPPDDARLSAHAAALREAQFEVVAQACAAADDVVVHVFSNNGAGAFAELLRRRPALAAKVRGVVFDSAATLDIGPNMANVVLGSVLGDLRRLEAPGATVAKVKDASLAANVAAVFAKPDGPTPMDAALAELVDATCPKAAPALFLYSSTDRLILAARVEEFADRVAAGRDDGAARLTRKVFDGSGHVRHLDAFPGEYAAAVGALLAEAMPEATSRVVG